LSDDKTLKHEQGVLTLAYSYDSKWLASAGYDRTIRVWNVQTGQEAWRIDNAHDDQIWSVMFSPDDHLLASASYDKTVKLWDLNNGEEQQGNCGLFKNGSKRF
jgi:WD40 repeat protein